MMKPDIFQDVPIGKLADWMRGHPGGRIAVFSRNFWHEAWDEARRVLSPGAARVVGANGQGRIEFPNGAIAYVLPLRPYGDAFRGRSFDALCLVNGSLDDLTQRQAESVFPSLPLRHP